MHLHIMIAFRQVILPWNILTEIQKRRNALAEIVEKINIIEREDSLQSIAAMSPADREAFLKKLSKKLTKERGIKDEDVIYSNSAADFFNTKNAPTDIFNTSNNTKGDWYFYNASVKSKGLSEFKKTWGKRQNVDNWRRASSARTGSQVNNGPGNDPSATSQANGLNQWILTSLQILQIFL